MSLPRLRTLSIPSLLIGLFLGAAGTAAFASVQRGSDVFSDIPEDAYYNEAVGALNGMGVIKGHADGKYHPGDSVTRADVAVMLHRFEQHLRAGGSASLRSERSRSSSVASSSSSSDADEGTGRVGVANSVRFTIGTFSVRENQAEARLSIVRPGASRDTATVEYVLADGTAKSGEDYTGASGQISFGPGETSKILTIQVLQDTLPESSETLMVTLRNPTGAAHLGVPATATLTITDDEITASSSSSSSSSPAASSAPGFAFGAVSYEMAENLGSIAITVIRTGGTSSAASVNYATANGTASAPQHYASSNGKLDFAAGETAKTFLVTLQDDASADGNRTVQLALSQPTGASLSTPAASTLTVADNEVGPFGAGAFKFDASSFKVSEGQGKALLTVRRVGGTVGAASVQFAVSGGNATAGTDYTVTAGALSFAPGEAKKTFTVTLVNDIVDDPEETVQFRLSDPTGGTTLLEPSTATVTIYE